MKYKRKRKERPAQRTGNRPGGDVMVTHSDIPNPHDG
jgi:hypothetical protein